MTYFVGVVATRSLWSRLPALLRSNELAGCQLLIESTEPKFQAISPSSKYVWDRLVDIIKNPLYANNLSTLDKLPVTFDINSLSFSEPLWMSYRALSQSEISVYSKHLQILAHFLKSSYDICLILEDDCYLEDGFSSLLAHLISEHSFDYIDLANGLNFIPNYNVSTPLQTFKSVLSIPPWVSTRTACAYLISRRLAYYFVNHFSFHYVIPYDWALNVALVNFKPSAKLYWCDTPYFIHGSKSGVYTSSISAEN